MGCPLILTIRTACLSAFNHMFGVAQFLRLIQKCAAIYHKCDCNNAILFKRGRFWSIISKLTYSERQMQYCRSGKRLNFCHVLTRSLQNSRYPSLVSSSVSAFNNSRTAELIFLAFEVGFQVLTAALRVTCCHSHFLLGLFFGPKYVCHMFLRNVG
jgi:hypothetical protein